MNKKQLKIKISPREFAELLLLSQSIQKKLSTKKNNLYFEDSVMDACNELNISSSWVWPALTLNLTSQSDMRDWVEEAKELEEHEGVRIERVKENN